MSLKDDLRRLVLDPSRGNGGLSDAPERDAIPAARGDANYEDDSDGGGGIKSPLTEQPASRTYHEERNVTSADGVFVIVYLPIKSTLFKDRAGNLVYVNYVDE